MDRSALSPIVRDPSIASHQERNGRRSVNISSAEHSPASRHIPLSPHEGRSVRKKGVGDVQKKSRRKKVASNARNAWNIDEDPEFWGTYVREAGEFDRELIDGWNQSLDILLIFAGLFSAINTAFIIESYGGLQPDVNEATLFLLRQILVHRNDNLVLSQADLGISENAYEPSSTSVRINSVFFASLSCSLIAAFGAVTAKQWLNQYTHVGSLAQPHEQGRRRHWKYRGLETWHFWLMMEILPAILQLSLVLFLWGTIEFLWPMSWKVATMIMVLGSAATVAYFASLIIAILVPNSPFQTTLSNSLQVLVKDSARPFRLIYRYIRKGSDTDYAWYIDLANRFRSMSITQTIQPLDLTDLGVRIGLMVYIGSLAFRGWLHERFHDDSEDDYGDGAPLTPYDPEIEPARETKWEKKDEASAECAFWLFEQAEHPGVTQRALNAITLLPADRIFPLAKAREGFLDRLVTLYNSYLTKGPGESGNAISSRPLDALLTGTALFHILKAGEQGDVVCHDISNRIRSLSDPPDNAESVLDMALLVIICGVEMQAGPSGNGIDLLRRLFSHVSHSQVVKATPSFLNEQSPGTADLVTTTTPFSLLLDILIYCIRLDTHWFGDEKVVDNWGRWGADTLKSFPDDYENILGAIHTALEDGPSLDIASHIAVAVATLQWKKRERLLIPWQHPPLHDSRAIGDILKTSWHMVDKRETTRKNIILALTLVGSKDSSNTLKIYKSLLGILEDLPPLDPKKRTSTEVTTAILRVYRQLLHDTATQHLFLRVLDLFADPGCVSPFHEENGDGIISLLSSVFYSESPVSLETRAAAVGLLDLLRYDGDFVNIITNSAGLYPHREGIARIQFAMWKEGQDETARSSPNDYITQVLGSTDDDFSLYAVQRETLVLALANAHCTGITLAKTSDSNPFREVSESIQGAFDRMMDEDSSVRWPAYFVTLGIITPDAERDDVADLSRLPGYRSVIEDASKCAIWIGEGLLIIWDDVIRGDHEESTYKVFFNKEVVDAMLQYHHLLLEKEVTSSSESIFRDYLMKAKEEVVDAGQHKEIEEGLVRLGGESTVVPLNHS